MLNFTQPENRPVLAAVKMLNRAVAAFADPAAHLAFKGNDDPVGSKPLLLQLDNDGAVHGRRADDDCNGIIWHKCEWGDESGDQTDAAAVAIPPADAVNRKAAGKER
jgi:hypothetical protein